MTGLHDPNTAVAISVPDQRELDARVRASKVPLDIGRVIASMVMGTIAVGTGSLGIVGIYALTKGAVQLGVALIMGSVILTAPLGFMIWRWARSLPLKLDMATAREREEIEG